MSRGDFVFDKEIFGERLLSLRKKKQVGQAVISTLLNVSTAQISDMENGKSGTTLDKLYILCQYYHVSADYLLGITDDPTWRGPEVEA